MEIQSFGLFDLKEGKPVGKKRSLHNLKWRDAAEDDELRIRIFGNKKKLIAFGRPEDGHLRATFIPHGTRVLVRGRDEKLSDAIFDQNYDDGVLKDGLIFSDDPDAFIPVDALTADMTVRIIALPLAEAPDSLSAARESAQVPSPLSSGRSVRNAARY